MQSKILFNPVMSWISLTLVSVWTYTLDGKIYQYNNTGSYREMSYHGSWSLELPHLLVTKPSGFRPVNFDPQ